jgi:putative ABC transport system permease protein
MALPLSYNVRNLRVRWQVTLLAIFGIALVVAVFIVLSAMASGFRLALRATGRTDNALVVQKGATSELTSGIARDVASVIMVDSRVARGPDGQPLASPEALVVVSLPRKTDGADVNVTVRGVTPRAFDVRGGITIVEGRRFNPGLYEIIVGERAYDRFGLKVGRSVKLQKKDWEIVGVYASEGSGFESEIWGDIDAVGPAFQRQGGYQVIALRLADPGTLPALKERLENDPQMQVSVAQERKYYEDQAGFVVNALMGLAMFVSIVMGIGAVFGAMNTMYAIVSARTREIGTLRALGFSRRSILFSFVTEAVFLALIGGLLGCLLAVPANGVTTATNGANFSELAFAFKITAPALVGGLIFAIVMGFLGGLFPAWRGARLPITSALREA